MTNPATTPTFTLEQWQSIFAGMSDYLDLLESEALSAMDEEENAQYHKEIDKVQDVLDVVTRALREQYV